MGSKEDWDCGTVPDEYESWTGSNANRNFRSGMGSNRPVARSVRSPYAPSRGQQAHVGHSGSANGLATAQPPPSPPSQSLRSHPGLQERQETLMSDGPAVLRSSHDDDCWTPEVESGRGVPSSSSIPVRLKRGGAEERMPAFRKFASVMGAFICLFLLLNLRSWSVLHMQKDHRVTYLSHWWNDVLMYVFWSFSGTLILVIAAFVTYQCINGVGSGASMAGSLAWQLGTVASVVNDALEPVKGALIVAVAVGMTLLVWAIAIKWSVVHDMEPVREQLDQELQTIVEQQAELTSSVKTLAEQVKALRSVVYGSGTMLSAATQKITPMAAYPAQP